MSLSTGLGGQKLGKIFKPLSVKARAQVMIKVLCGYIVFQGKYII